MDPFSPSLVGWEPAINEFDHRNLSNYHPIKSSTRWCFYFANGTSRAWSTWECMDLDRPKQEAMIRRSNARVALFTGAWHAKSSHCMHPSIRSFCISNASIRLRPWLAQIARTTFRLEEPMLCDLYLRSWLRIVPNSIVCNPLASIIIPHIEIARTRSFQCFPSPVFHLPCTCHWIDMGRVLVGGVFLGKAVVLGRRGEWDGIGANWGDPTTETEQSKLQNRNDSWCRCNQRVEPIKHVRWRTTRWVGDRTHGKERTT